MTRLLDALDRARSNPESDIHLALQLSTLFESLENEEELSEDVNLQLEEIEGDYLLSGIVACITEWYHDSDFQSALDCLDELETAITDAQGRNWDNVAAEYHHRRIKLRADLRGHDADDEIEDALAFLETQHETISSNYIVPIVEITIDNIGDVSSDVRDQWGTLINDLAARNNSEGRFNQERTCLRSLRDLQLACSQSTSAVEDNLVGSYRNEADSIGQRSAMQMADTLEGGVAACGQYMSEARRTQ